MSYQKGQSAIEYILLAACFIAFLIVFLAPNGPMKNTIELNINKSVDQIGAMVNITDFASGLIPEPVVGTTNPPPPPPNCSSYTSKASCTYHLDACMWWEPHGTSCNLGVSTCKALNPGFCQVYNPATGVCCTAHASCNPSPCGIIPP